MKNQHCSEKRPRRVPAHPESVIDQEENFAGEPNEVFYDHQGVSTEEMREVFGH